MKKLTIAAVLSVIAFGANAAQYQCHEAKEFSTNYTAAQTDLDFGDNITVAKSEGVRFTYAKEQDNPTNVAFAYVSDDGKQIMVVNIDKNDSKKPLIMIKSSNNPDRSILYRCYN